MEETGLIDPASATDDSGDASRSIRNTLVSKTFRDGAIYLFLRGDYAGLTHAQGKALTGHATDAEFNRYARHANQEQLAEEGMANLEARLAKSSGKAPKNKQKR